MALDRYFTSGFMRLFCAEASWRLSMERYLKIILSVFTITFGAQAFAFEVPANDLLGLLWPSDKVMDTVDVHGKIISPIELHDHLVVSAFVSANCNIICVNRIMDLDKMSRQMPKYLRDRVIFLAIDTDPDVDDTKSLRTFADHLLEPGSQLKFIRANVEVAKSVMEKLHYPAAALPEPPPTILLFDRRGRVAMSYGGDPLDASRLERDLAALDTFPLGLGHPPTQAPDETRPAH